MGVANSCHKVRVSDDGTNEETVISGCLTFLHLRYTHTYIHTYIMCMHTYIHTYIQTYIHTLYTVYEVNQTLADPK